MSRRQRWALYAATVICSIVIIEGLHRLFLPAFP